MANRVTMGDIAKEAGVSVTTVSYIINKRPDQVIAQQTIDRVNEAIKRLGYVPNLGARALASKKTKLLGLVIPQTEKEERMMFSNTFYGEFLSAFEYEARKNGYNILISGKDIDNSYVQTAKQRCLDGVVAVGLTHGLDLKELEDSDIPLVLVDSYVGSMRGGRINTADLEGGRLATDYLIGRGHRRIGLLTGFTNERGVNSERFNGYLRALEDAGIPSDPRFIYSGTVSYAFGEELGRRLAKDEERPTAVFATADILAVGLIKGLKAGGLDVPGDVSVIGFDDGLLARLSDPGLTSVRQDVSQKAILAAQMIIAEVDRKDWEAGSVTLPVSLTERDSVSGIEGII